MTGLYPDFDKLIRYWLKVGEGAIPRRSVLRLLDLVDISTNLSMMDITVPGQAILGFVGARTSRRLGDLDSGSDMAQAINPQTVAGLALLGNSLFEARCGAISAITSAYPRPDSRVDVLMLPLRGGLRRQKFVLLLTHVRVPDPALRDMVAYLDQMRGHKTTPVDLGFGVPEATPGGIWSMPE